MGCLMPESVEPITSEISAIYNHEARSVYFQHLTISGMEACGAPRGYAVPKGYRIIETPKQWPASSTKWVV